MIEGLKIEIDTAQLRGRLEERARHHRERAAFYSKNVTGFDDEGIDKAYVTNDPRQSMMTSARHHAERAGFFALVADHLIEGEVYRLTDGDLMRLELVSQYL